jgi:dihydropteroate synthase
MGILNITPDSFSDGGRYQDKGKALEHALRMEREGAHFLDVGGESSRPGARPISAKEEIRRITPVLRLLMRKVKIPVSIDTWKAEVAHAALDEGASLVNDIRGLRGNRRMGKLIARYKAGVVLMHMKGTPRSMQKKPFYGNPTREILHFLKLSVRTALDSGIHPEAIAVDPGFGFGKTTAHNLEILKNLTQFSKLKRPVLVGLSKKSFIGHILDAGTGERLYGSLGAAAVAVAGGAHILRVHDVLPHRHLAALMDRVLWN